MSDLELCVFPTQGERLAQVLHTNRPGQQTEHGMQEKRGMGSGYRFLIWESSAETELVT